VLTLHVSLTIDAVTLVLVGLGNAIEALLGHHVLLLHGSPLLMSVIARVVVVECCRGGVHHRHGRLVVTWGAALLLRLHLTAVVLRTDKRLLR